MMDAWLYIRYTTLQLHTLSTDESLKFYSQMFHKIYDILLLFRFHSLLVFICQNSFYVLINIGTISQLLPQISSSLLTNYYSIYFFAFFVFLFCLYCSILFAVTVTSHSVSKFLWPCQMSSLWVSAQRTVLSGEVPPCWREPWIICAI